MHIDPVNEATLPLAAQVHALSWQESHRSICSPDFVAAHTPQRQADMLRQEMDAGKQLYLLTDDIPVGMVAVAGYTIEHLYVLPGRQRRGYGSLLLEHAVACCQGTPTLWVLNANDKAMQFYLRHGFRPTGEVKAHSNTLWETEMRLERN